MGENDKRLFKNLKPVSPPAGLFDKIIFAIKQEEELRRTKRTLFAFAVLLVVSLIATPLSWAMLVSQMQSSGVFYFISTAISDFNTFFALWREFIFAIVESLPIMGIIVFATSFGIALFTLRLFLYKRKLLIKYLIGDFNLI